jgi:hypothetical protein
MNRRGFIGSVVSVIASASLVKAASEPEVTVLPRYPVDSPKAKQRWMASGWYDEQGREYVEWER